MLGPLRIAQVVSLVEITIGILGLLWLYKLRRSLPDVVRIQESDVTSNTTPNPIKCHKKTLEIISRAKSGCIYHSILLQY